MSKINIGVGDEFPLDESPAGEDRHARRHHHHHRHHRHRGHFHPRHHRHHGFLHLPLLIIAVAIIAVLIGVVQIPLLAAHAILVMAGLFVLLAVLAHWHLHRHHRHGEGA